MPTKKTKDGREYDVTGKTFTWHPLDDNDEPGNLPDIVIPMRLKLKVIRTIAGREQDVAAMFAILEGIAPGCADALDEMDVVTDFEPMFTTWQAEYNALTGATLGE